MAAFAILALGVRTAPANKIKTAKLFQKLIICCTGMRMDLQRLLLPVKRHQVLYPAAQCAAAAPPPARTGIFGRLFTPQVELRAESTRSYVTASARRLVAHDVVVDRARDGGAAAGHDAA